MGPFIGRQRELKMLEEAYRGRDSAFIPIYGRRRVGKSALLAEFARPMARGGDLPAPQAKASHLQATQRFEVLLPLSQKNPG